VEKGLYWDIDLTSEQVEQVIQDVYKKISEYKMETIAILTLESLKPWSYVGGELVRAALSPFMPAFGESLGLTSEKMLQVFEDRKNIETLIQLLEENLKREEAERKKRKEEAKEKRKQEKEREEAVKKALKDAEKRSRKGWCSLP
jgi:hypothetical protein